MDPVILSLGIIVLVGWAAALIVAAFSIHAEDKQKKTQRCADQQLSCPCPCHLKSIVLKI